MARLGYARVSLADQNTDLQIRELEAAGCELIYKDQGISGTRVNRPELDRMLDRLGRGDEVVVWKLDRLGRNTRHLLELLDDFKVRGIKFRSLRDGIATDPASEVGGAMAQAMVTIISAFAQLNETSSPSAPRPAWRLQLLTDAKQAAGKSRQTTRRSKGHMN
ncbi:recombinase family protein [Paenarthrobacter sp. YIM B13468]|uniref:recombinase family protein n=1 Tax=Paenarthrobacter sp. YIM B13468 TaxID=3366295 RepID=UPI00366C245C